MKDYSPLHILKQIDDNIWIVDGDKISFFGLPFPTRMTIIRLNNGDLFLHSPTTLTPELKREVESLGTIKHLVSPNWIHYAYINQWQEAFQNTVAWASPNVRKRAKKAKSTVVFNHDLGEAAAPEWADEINQIIVHGSSIHTEVVFFHKSSKTLILTDLIENFEADKVPIWFKWLAKLAGILDPNGKHPRDMQMSFWRGKKQLRHAVNIMLAWQPDKIILAHGRWYQTNAINELKRAFKWALQK